VDYLRNLLLPRKLKSKVSLTKELGELRRNKSLPKDANILHGRSLLTIKNTRTESETFKARYIVRGYRDKEKGFLVHNSSTIRQNYVRLIFSTAAIFGFRIWSQDVRQAYLQSSETLRRKVYLKPSNEFQAAVGSFS
jgi:Reverse transcriptase (RNA-dependent DNA polymerase)